ncbi:MAG: hypothetical protein ACTH9E_00935, partial [Serratia proteamaculans]
MENGKHPTPSLFFERSICWELLVSAICLGATKTERFRTSIIEHVYKTHKTWNTQRDYFLYRGSTPEPPKFPLPQLQPG